MHSQQSKLSKERGIIMKTIDELLKDIKSGDLRDEFIRVSQENEGLPVQERFEFIIGFARDHGYDISVEDLTLVEADRQTLDDKELDRMAAGGMDLESREHCHFDYICGVAWNSCYVTDECAHSTICEGNLH